MQTTLKHLELGQQNGMYGITDQKSKYDMYALCQQPYPAMRGIDVGYGASAIDQEGNEYEIFWPELQEWDGEDESAACNWGKAHVRKLGVYQF